MGVLDAKSLPKGKYFDKLPENYVIFIRKKKQTWITAMISTN